MSTSAEVVEQFYGVYLLYCKNPQYTGRTYIGYTVDPNRRIKQHNRGQHAGGARKTSNKGPWIMAMIIHGFPNNIAALRFEWAWQMPLKSRRLAHLPGITKSRKENLFQYNIRILSTMLRIGPWNRLPLTVRWLSDDLVTDFPIDKPPPMHVPICYGPVVSKKIPNSQMQPTQKVSDKINEVDDHEICNLCNKVIQESKSKITCLTLKCQMKTHLICLAKIFLEPGEYVPVQGRCPKCEVNFLWGDLVRKARGCYSDLKENSDDCYSSDSEFNEDD